LPAAARVAAPLPDAPMRTPVHRDDACVMDHLVEKHHVSRPLEKLNILVVSTRNHRRSGIEPQYATLAHASVLPAEPAPARGLDAGGQPLLSIRREGRKFPVWRIHNQRALLAPDGCPRVDPERIVRAGVAFSGPAIAINEALRCSRFHLIRFL